MGLFVVSVIGFIVCGIILLIKAIRKKPKKVIGVLTGVFFVVALATMIWAMNTPAVDPTQMIGEDPRPKAVEADFVKINAGEWEGKFVKAVGEVSLIKLKTDQIIIFDLTTQEGDGYGVYSVEAAFNVGEIERDIAEGDRVVVYGTVEKPNDLMMPVIGASIIEKGE